jgi:hypothetical protein
MRKNLVMARVGARSLHRGWFDEAQARNWDLYLSPYEATPPLSDVDCVVGEVIAGPKWSGLRQVLQEWDGWREYDQIWLPDDDIRASQAVVNAMFDMAAAMGLRLYAPALDRASYYGHFITKQNPRFFGRRVGFVEIMVPGFDAATLEALLPTLDLTETGWGWGLDSVWPKLLNYKDIGIFDGLTVTHTRPIGAARDADLFGQLLAESDKLLRLYDCRQVHTTFAGFGADLKPVDLTPDELLIELIGGWDYLIDKDARLLAWIADFHLQHFGVEDYPAEGTPSS